MKKSPATKTVAQRVLVNKAVESNKIKPYSEKELDNFREIIVNKLDEAKKNMVLLLNTLSHKDNNGTEDTSPTFKIMEDGSDFESKEETAQLVLRERKFIQNLQNALIRIENKTYGICRITGKLIPKGRLLSVPHATLCIDVKLGRPFDKASLYIA